MYVGRPRDTIRDEILALWSVQYAAIGLRLLVAPRSDAYLLASVLAVQLEGLESQLEQVGRDILPDQASPEAVQRHGYVDGVARRPGTVARHSVTVTNAADGTKAIPVGSTMAYSDGTRYSVADASVVISGGSGVITAVALEPGSAGTRAVGNVLTFTAAITGLDPTGTVASGPTFVEGTNEESIADWAQHIIELRQERPGSGNRSEWREWVTDYQGTVIDTAFVYPLLEPPPTFPGAGTPSTPGCVTVIAVGPAQGTRVENTRLVPYDDASARTSGAELPFIRGYIEGTRTITGVPTDTGTQLRPVTMLAENASVEAFLTTQQNIVIECEMNEANAFAWTGSHAITSASSTTIVVAGDQTALNGLIAQVLVDAPTTLNTRGGYRVYTLPVGVFAAGETTWTFSTPFPDTPTGSIYPATPADAAIRTAVFAYFDGLGPGDTTPPSRWPPESSGARATLYLSALAATALTSVPSVSAQGALVLTPTGVLSATVTTPVADITPGAKTVVILGRLLLVAA